jgi:hypothetical protein
MSWQLLMGWNQKVGVQNLALVPGVGKFHLSVVIVLNNREVFSILEMKSITILTCRAVLSARARGEDSD